MPHKLARVRGRLRKHLARGWQRAVFSPRQRPENAPSDDITEPQVVEGPGTGDPDDPEFSARRDAAFDALMRVAAEAADAGRVKQIYVLDERRQVRVDARHGHAKLRERDEDSLRKTMGGKDRPLRPDTSGALLRAIGIMNADGSISARNAKKYKQVNHLVELCRPVWQHALEQRAPGEAGPLRIVDLACGNSYLDFVLAHVLDAAEVPFSIVGIDVRDDVIERSRARAASLGYADAVHFLVGSIADTGQAAIEALGGPPELAIALHACDTATDEALALAIDQGARTILAAPCCQAELARQLAQSPAGSGPALTRHGLLRRAYADALTDALRVEMLEACGYAVTVVEFVDSEHTAKNLLIRALLRSSPLEAPRERALGPVAERCAELGVRPTLLDLLAPGISV
jgi:SAM-dependent methyltransferase